MLTFTKAERNAGRKTDIFTVRSSMNQAFLGTISWYGRWRRYVFFPMQNTLFDVSCLREIADFINEQMLLRDPAKKYNPEFGDDKICGRRGCGHPYYRHFDWAENYAVGCKYCPCVNFKEKT